MLIFEYGHHKINIYLKIRVTELNFVLGVKIKTDGWKTREFVEKRSL